MINDKVCEHCLIGMKLFSLYGNFRVYECAKNIHPKDWLAGFEEPCYGYCTKKKMCSWEEAKKNNGWFYHYSFSYKHIPYSEMKKSKSCLKQEDEDKKETQEKAKKLRNQAEKLIIEAHNLERM